jgi:hypothetical protein
MYEIPQQLEYKEKIVFGLTFGQLIYAMIFLPFAIIFFRLNIPLSVKFFLIFIPVSLAAGFMFFDLSSKIKNWYWWYKFREIKESLKIKKLFGARVSDNSIFVT